MEVFKKKTTLVHHIAYMGLTTAINVIFIVLATYVQFLTFLLVLLLPFISAVVSYYCQKRYYIIYAVASVLLCFIFNISDTLFYVLPAIITGFFIGLLLEKKINPFWLILVSSVIESILTFALIPLINLLGSVEDIVDAFFVFFKLSTFTYKEELTFLFIFCISLMQSTLTHFILLSDAKKVGIEVNTCTGSFGPYIIGNELAIALSLTFSFFYNPLAFVFLVMSLYFTVFLIINLILEKKKSMLISMGIIVVVVFFTFSFLYSMIERPYGLLLLNIFPLLISLLSFVNYYLLNKEGNI